MNNPLASLGQRFTAQFIDHLIAIALGVAFYFAAKFLSLSPAYWALGYFPYWLLRDGLPNGQSLGKKILGITVVHYEKNTPCAYWQSVLRNISSLLLSFFDVIFVLGDSKRRLGDYLARTKVVLV